MVGRPGLSGVELVLLSPHFPVPSLWLERLSAVYLWVSSFHPLELNEPLRISEREGAFDAMVPVAAHMPGGGDASINLILAVRMRLVVDVVDALVEARVRCAVGEEDVWGGEFDSGRGKGTGVETLVGEVMVRAGDSAAMHFLSGFMEWKVTR